MFCTRSLACAHKAVAGATRGGLILRAKSTVGRPHKKNLKQLFSNFSDHWSPKIAGEINSMHLKLVKVEGDFVWHHHEVEDELFLVTGGGPLHMKIRDPEERVETINKGEFIIIPAGVEHCPYAKNECEIILLEPNTTLNTGNVKDDVKTVNK